MAISGRTWDGATTSLDPTTVANFGATLRGALLQPSDHGYDQVRRIHNGMIDRRPALIARCAGTADVLHAVRFARDHRLLVSVRSGGHGVAGFAVCDGGFMIDLSLMKGVHVDPSARTARAESGVTWGEFDHETEALGLATTGGVARPTGIAGLTLGGGHGLLMRKCGLACDNLQSVDVVTADGRLLTANRTEHPDLFWALRGGGGNFGLVTSFEFALHPVGPILGGLLMFPLDEAPMVLRRFHAFMGDAPDELGAIAVLATLPDGTKALVFLLAYNGPVSDGERVLRPLRTSGSVIADHVGLMPYTAVQSIVEQFNPPGLRNYWKTGYMREITPDAIDVMVERARATPSPFTHPVVYALGGAVGRVGPEDTAVAHRDASYAFLVVGMWSDASEDADHVSWVREYWNEMRPHFSAGSYPNYEGDATDDRVRAAYGSETLARLASIKQQYDPDNFFRLNQNIAPAR